jgi:hypothetical protein
MGHVSGGSGAPSAMGAPREAWQTPAVAVAARPGDGQGRATAEAPRPMGGPDRIPGQRPADPPATPCAGPTASPRLPLRAAPPASEPGVPRLEPRLGLRNAHIPVPPFEVPPQRPEDLAPRHPSCPGGQPAPLRLERPPGPHPPPACPVPRLPPRRHPSTPRRAARSALQGRGLGPTAAAPSSPPFRPAARARLPPMPAADFCLPVSRARSPRRPCPGCRRRGVGAGSAWVPGGATRLQPDRRLGRQAALPG